MGKTLTKRLAGLSAAALAGTGLAVSGGSPAFAGADGCNGNLVYTQNVYGTGSYANQLVATIDTYWDGTYNCDVAVKNVLVGTPSYMELTIYSNAGNSHDYGTYSYYAGPVKVNGRGSCVWEGLFMTNAAGNYSIADFGGPHHSCT